MTVVAAVVDSDGVGYMVADSRVTEAHGVSYSVHEGKVWRSGAILIGWMGFLRTGQALRYGLSWPPYKNGQDPFEYLCGPFVDAVRACIKTAGAGCAPSRDGSELLDTSLLIVWQGRIFRMGTDLGISEHRGAYAIGSGSLTAIGALRALWDYEPKTRLLRAVQIAAEVHNNVAPPYTLLSTADAPPEVHP
ncbi:hypothetical protein [Deinococcus sp. Leaf326]|uniref:hypothetical protein n=1 Tax=Deinococcus sp. Leaf326 TaxID=1736338 RepID=UPI0007002A7B|nr:hypothetical protein [Deinococcus sp. Leaf326]KQR40758.1 hypothetical protein ASF71_00900 [Deinococcus sp. Leaf326]